VSISRKVLQLGVSLFKKIILTMISRKLNSKNKTAHSIKENLDLVYIGKVLRF
jgi:hypothetical protein